jgi:hypothetical protein
VAPAALAAAFSVGTRKTLAVRVVLAASFAFAFAFAPVALADKGGNGGNPKQAATAQLSLVYEQTRNSPNPAAPTGCLNEDDYHQRTWSGSLSGSFTAAEQLCDANVDYSGGLWWDAGGIGLQADLYVVGTLSDLTITSPQGDAHQAVLIGSTTSKGLTINHYEVCYVPGYSVTYNIGGTPLPGGTWQITLSGNIATVPYKDILSYHGGFSVTGDMTDTAFQQQYCPASERNLFAW